MIQNWVKQLSVYPPSILYAGLSQTKTERQAIQVCENLYKFNFGDKRNVLGEVKAAWRELEVLAALRQTSDLPFRAVYIRQVVAEFKKKMLLTERELNKFFSQHKDLTAYYDEWKLSPDVLSKSLDDYVSERELNDARNY